MMPKVSKSGWLKKQGGLVRSWQDRWFVLKGQSLFHYTKDDESRQQGIIELIGCKCMELPYTNNRDEPEKWLFEISQAQRAGRANETYLLWADCEVLRIEWMSALRRAIYESVGGGVFGGPLLQITQYDKENYNCKVPHVVKQCVEIILANGKEVEGIFRLSGRVSLVKEMRRRYDEGQRPDLSDEQLDVHTAASLLKLYFRELPEPVIPFEYFESFLSLATSFKYNSNHKETFANLKSLVRQIPEENFKLLDYLTSFLYEISKYQHINKMTEKNISVIFGTNILRGLDDSPEFQMATQNLTTHVVLALVKWHDLLFCEPSECIDEQVVDEKEFEQLVSLSEEPSELEISNSGHVRATSVQHTNPPDGCAAPDNALANNSAVDDLLGVDFTTTANDQVFTPAADNQMCADVNKPKSRPPIPKRRNEPTSLSSKSLLENGRQSNSNEPHDASHSMTRLDDTVAKRIEIQPLVRRKGGSTKGKARPAPIVQPRFSTSRTPSPPNRKSGSLPVTKIERATSNFTSFIDSPLDERVSLNIGDLPNSVEDLQSLVLSLKIQLKEERKAKIQLKQERELMESKYKQQMSNLAATIYQERQSRDEAVARVVDLANQLTMYQSKYGDV